MEKEWEMNVLWRRYGI